jgi:transposase
VSRGPDVTTLLDFDGGEFKGLGAIAKRLAYAQLCDAIACVKGQGGGKKHERDAEQVAAQRWIAAMETDFMGFVGICSTLNLPAEKLRAALLDHPESINIVLDRLGRAHRCTEVDVKAVRAMVASGALFKKVAKHFQIQQRTVAALAGDLVEARRRARNLAVARAHLKEGKSYRQVSEEFQISKSHAERICGEYLLAQLAKKGRKGLIAARRKGRRAA